MGCTTILLLLLMSRPLFTEGLFEDALQNKSAASALAPGSGYELNGSVRSGVYVGPGPKKTGYETRRVYGECALKLRVRKGDFGNAFSEVRLLKEIQNGNGEITAVVREAYVNAYVGSLDLRIGQQIVVWGRADGYNPTNSMTPLNLLCFSPDEDDRRESNFLIRACWNGDGVRIEALWVPVYRPSALPLAQAELPEGVHLGAPEYPGSHVMNSAGAVKLHFERASIDGSLCYFNGYAPAPGLRGAFSEMHTVKIFPAAYRTQLIGGDFSTAIGPYGLRGEFAFTRPSEKDDIWQSIPNAQMACVLGIDRTFGNFSLILQYIGKHAWDFHQLSPQADAARNDVAKCNRMYFAQQEKWTHALSFRPAWKWLHETLDVEVLGQINFSTKEVFLIPKLSYDLGDDLNLTLGVQCYAGPDETLYGEIGSRMSACFADLNASF